MGHVKEIERENSQIRRSKKEKEANMIMTAIEAKEKILNKYAIGQEVNIRFRNDQGKIMARKKARILKYYPHMIMCEVDRWQVSFTYGDFNRLIKYGGKG